MNSLFNKYQIRVFSTIAAVILLLCTVYVASVAEAASPYGRYGWTDPISSIEGDDFTCLDPGEVALTLEVRDLNTNATTTVASAIIAIFDKTGPTNVYVTHAEGSGPRIGPVCYNPDTDSVAYDIDGGANYRNFSSSFVDRTSALMPRQKAMTGVVWVTPVAVSTPEYQQVSPSPAAVLVTNVSPSYTYQVNYLHNAYGADALSMVNLFVVNFDPSLPNYTTAAVSKVVNQSGGVGNKTIPAEILPDGWYGWSLYLHSNKNHTITTNYEALNVPKSGFLNLWAPFVLDTTPPVFTSVSHTPVVPAPTSTITISSNVTDVLSGVTKVELYVDGVLNKTCNYGAVASTTCSTVVGPYIEGTIHPYYVRATDLAGNSSTSTTNNIVVFIPPEHDISAKNTAPATGASFTTTQNITFTGNATNSLATAVVEGGWADLEIDWYSDGTGTKGAYDANFNANGGAKLGSFTPGQIKPLSYTMNAGTVPVGTHRYRFHVDTDNTGVPGEADETNNRSAWVTFTVLAATCPTGETMNWTVGSDSCTGTIGTSRSPGKSENVIDSTEDPAVGIAAFSCRADTTWDPIPLVATCTVPLPLDVPIDVNVSVDRELIRVGTTATVTIEVSVDVVATCTVYGATNIPFTFTHSGSPVDQSYSYATRVLNAAQVITVSCSPDVVTFGVVAGTGKARIEVVPELQEI